MNTDQYNKLVGGVAGVLTGWAVAKNILPPELNTPELQLMIQTAITSFYIWAFPPNKT